MKKKILSLAMVIGLAGLLTACSSNSATAEPADLTGEWKQVNSDSEDSWQAATIEGDTITINWVSDNGDTTALYWAGTYVAPTTTDEPYTWDSVNDHDQTDSAMFASGDDTKTITYEDGQLSYATSVMGVDTTVRLEKQN